MARHGLRRPRHVRFAPIATDSLRRSNPRLNAKSRSRRLYSSTLSASISIGVLDLPDGRRIADNGAWLQELQTVEQPDHHHPVVRIVRIIGVRIAPENVSLAVPLKSPVSAIAQLLSTAPRVPLCSTEGPFISQIATLPELSRQRMSLKQPPLKSWVLVGGATKAHAAPCCVLSCGPPTMAVLQDGVAADVQRDGVALPSGSEGDAAWVHSA